MRLAPYVEELQQQLAVATDPGSPEAVALAERVAAALDPAVRLVLLDALAAAAAEITRDLAPGSVDVRLRGRDPEFVVTRFPAHGSADDPRERTTVLVAPEPPAGPPEGEESGSTRTTLRLPEHLKARMEAAAEREGVSINTWLVRAITSALDHHNPPGHRRDEDGGERFTGWVRYRP